MRRNLKLVCGALLFVASPAMARLRHRVPAFEPTDLDLEDPGVVELDLQVGVVRRDADPRSRLYAPDFELDFGLTERVEIDIDGALAFDRALGTWSYSGDSLWTCTKLGFVSDKDPLDSARVWALGMQLGPRWPTVPHSVGSGFGAVLLGSRMAPPFHVILNAGGVLEPKDRTSRERSAALVTGIDLDFDLDRADRWSLLGEVAGGYSLGPDPHDLHVTAGIDWAPNSWFELSLVAFYGFLRGGDRSGAFAGVAPKFGPGITSPALEPP